CSTCLDKP
nr:RecName: Full=Toxin To31; AltName: Full=Toxin Tc31 [Tityus obscurus]